MALAMANGAAMLPNLLAGYRAGRTAEVEAHITGLPPAVPGDAF